MSVSFSVIFEASVPPHGTLGSDNIALSRQKEALDRLASENGLTPLSSFESYDPADFAEFMDEDELDNLPEVQWFDPAVGLAAVRALAQFISSDPDAAPGGPELLADLISIEKECAEAEKAGVRFRFAVVP